MVVTNDAGNYAILCSDDYAILQQGELGPSAPRFDDLSARGLLDPKGPRDALALAAARTRKAFLLYGPSLHIFVVTLRCDHSCQYCQVSRAAFDASGFDLSESDAEAALDRVFESNSPHLTIEFQGGEPALRFDRIRQIVFSAERRNEADQRALRFTIATTLHHLGHEELEFCRDHGIHLSTSIDGIAAIHVAQRPNPTRDSFARTIEGLERARAVLGTEGVVALPTITRAMLEHPEALVDAYVSLGFRSLFLRPLSAYGFARKSQRALGYSMAEFIAFYRRTLEYILTLNANGIEIEETNAAIALRHILTPFHSGYADLRSPTAAGLGTLVYNYDGQVYPTDEARMAAATGDGRFALGSVETPLDELLASPTMTWLMSGGIAEEMPGCETCAFVPYCGADPVFHAVAQGDPAAQRAGTEFCDRQLAIFDLVFCHIADADPSVMRTFLSWAMSRPRAEIPERAWIEQ